jgi:peptidoglycan/xylan/chitin deacetylase (PgdA/CDA1 family)
MADHIICMTFDFDAMSGLVARGMKTPTPISRGEFGAMAAYRILSLLRKYDIKSTWFIPGVVIGNYPEQCTCIHADGHEIGHHGWTHTPPANLSAMEEEEGLKRGNEAIAKITGQPARGYRSPSWDLSSNTVDLLISHDFLYDSSMMGDDYTPYYVRKGDIVEDDAPVIFGETTSLIEMPISWSLDDFPHFEFLRMPTSVMPGLMNANLVLENWINDYEYMRENLESGILTYTFHPYVIGRGHRIMALERLIIELRDRGAKFCTMEDAARIFKER